jgi:hypothetical protein
MAAWRPYEHVAKGELDNTTPGRVTGWISFVGIDQPVTFDLVGDFHRDIRGAKIELNSPNPPESTEEMRAYMAGFARHQTGVVGDITAGLEPMDYCKHPYIEWYSDENGRVVLELEPEHVQVIGTPRPWQTEEPVSREQQEQNMARFLAGLSASLAPQAETQESQSESSSHEPSMRNHTNGPIASPNPVPEAFSEQQGESLTERSMTMAQEQNNNTQQENAVPEQKNPPLYELQMGKLRGQVFQNQSEAGVFYSASIFRTFTGRDGTVITSYRVREQDIPAAFQLLQQAQECIRTEREQTKSQAPENAVRVTRTR